MKQLCKQDITKGASSKLSGQMLHPKNLQYACPVYHNSMPSYLSELESLQKHATRIIHPFGSLELANLETAHDPRQAQTTKTFS